MKNNDTFSTEDEWYVKFGPQVTPDEAKTITPLNYRLITREVLEKKRKFEAERNEWYSMAKHDYYGILWKYLHVLKHFRENPPPPEPDKPIKPFKKPKR